MALQILILHQGSPVLPLLPLARGGLAQHGHRAARRLRRHAAYYAPPQGPQLRTRLVRHWTALARRTQPDPLPGVEVRARDNTSSRGLLRRCEALLRILLRRRRRLLGLKQRDIAHVTRSFDIRRFTADGSSASLAYVLALMHWRGCSLPTFLLCPPLHPPTGLVRWLATFTVMDQVDNGRQLFDLLALEEERVFKHAITLVQAMERMTAARPRRHVLLLPELLNESAGPKFMQRVRATTRCSRKIKHLAMTSTP